MVSDEDEEGEQRSGAGEGLAESLDGGADGPVGDAGEPRVEDAPADGAAGEADDSPVSDGARAFVHGLVALGLTVFGVLATLLGVIPVLLFGQDTVVGFGLSLVLGEVGFVLVGVGFLLVTRRGFDYLDLRFPGSSQQWAVVVGFTVGAFVVRTVAIVVAAQVGVQPAGSSIGNTDLPFEVLAALLLPTMLLVVGPAEELLFRGVIQKYLREATSATTAIAVAGVLFGSIHVFSLVQSTSLGTVVSLVVITAVGMGLGWLYEYTGSLPAAMLAHGGYNALIVASAWGLQVLGGGEAVVLGSLA